MSPLRMLWCFCLLWSPWLEIRTAALPTVRPGCTKMEFETAYYDGPPLDLPVPTNFKVKLHCKQKYHEAIAYSACAGMDEWEDPFPHCKLVRCPPVDAVNHGSVNVKSTPGFGDEAHLQCDEDYWYDGTDDVRVCQRNETWTGAWGQCQAKAIVQCLRPEIKAHMKIVPNIDVYGYGDSINVRCEVGFRYGGAIKRSCKPGNTWTGNEGTCERIMCPPILDFDNGKAVPVCNQCPYNTTLTISCYRGFKYNGTSFTCGQNGAWMGSGDCKRIECEEIPSIKNGFINVSGNVFEDSAVVKCNEGLAYEGPGSITCQNNGIWTHPGSCHPQGQPESPRIGMVLGLVIPAFILIVAGILFYMRWKMKKVPEMSMKKIIRQKDHNPERILDKPINLDKQFIQLKVITQRDDEDDLNESVSADKYKRYLERSHQADISIKEILFVKEKKKKNPVVLMQGRAGVGKTTLIQKIILMWAKNEWAKKYQLALLFNLRTMMSKDQRKFTLKEFLIQYSFYNLTQFNPSNFDSGIEAQGDKWLIFMDAIDEFPQLEKRMDDTPEISEGDSAEVCTWCINIWRRNVLKKSTILLSSRHIKKLKRINLDKTIEVVGLTEEKVKEYIEVHVKDDKQQKVRDNLTMNPTLISVASITFFCMKLCQVFADDDVTDHVKDLTTYTRITTFLLKMYVKRDFSVNENADENTHLLVKQMANLPGLARLAFNGLVQNNGTDLAQLIFDGEDLKKAELSNDDVSNASEQALITKIEHSGSANGDTSLVEFAHLSIQEVLAMVHLVTQDVDKISETLGSMWESSRFSMAQLYLLGLLYDEKCSWIHDITNPESQRVHATKPNSMSRMSQIQDRISSLLIEKVSKVEKHQHLRAIQMAYESQNPQVAATIGKSLYGEGQKIEIVSMPLTAVDVNGILFIIKESQSIHTLVLVAITLDKTSIGLIADFLKEDKMLFDLILHSNNIGDEGMEKLAPALRDNKTLTSINLAGNKIGAEGMEKLAPALRDNKTLTSIVLYNNNIGDEGMEKLAPALRDNKTLTSIDLDNNNIGDEGMEKLAPALRDNNTLTSIDLSVNNIGDKGMEKLAPALRDNKTLTSIELYNNNIGAEGMEKMASALRDNKTLTSIDLRYNPIDEKASSSIGRILKENKSLEKIQLDNSDLTMTYEGIRNILCGLQVNTTVQALSIDVPDVATPDIRAFTDLLEKVFTENTVAQIKFYRSSRHEDAKNCIQQTKYYGSRIHCP